MKYETIFCRLNTSIQRLQGRPASILLPDVLQEARRLEREIAEEGPGNTKFRITILAELVDNDRFIQVELDHLVKDEWQTRALGFLDIQETREPFSLCRWKTLGKIKKVEASGDIISPLISILVRNREYKWRRESLAA